MDFGLALNEMKRGAKIVRLSWGDGAMASYIKADGARVLQDVLLNGEIAVSGRWIPMDDDLLADDWKVLK